MPWVFAAGRYEVHALSMTDDGEWLWANHGGPGLGLELPSSAGGVDIRDHPSGLSRPYLFTCDYFNVGPVWSNWWGGGRWNWTQQPGTKAFNAVPRGDRAGKVEAWRNYSPTTGTIC
ncbi:hypothetical protein ACN27F_24310 [Solwaraspora sp. WMMB335]|uniref:hypothetical protein n=1 Tax=Solwaraspora sp. WMMB335 TaxID=3404118 RepID=UPI003B948DA9